MVLFIILVVILLAVILLINLYIVCSTKNKIVKDISLLKDIECIIVLGARVYNNMPCNMLRERLDDSIYLYKNNICNKILMSGDSVNEDYDEVGVMKEYAVLNGVKEEDILVDKLGLSTYDSIYRAKYIFEFNKVVVVTQRYHLFRSLFIGNRFNMECYGYSSFNIRHSKQFVRDFREVLARFKDFVTIHS